MAKKGAVAREEADKIPNESSDKHLSFVRAVRESSDAAVKALVEVMKSGKPREQVAAAKTLLAYSWGQPRQAIEISGDMRISADELIKHIHSDGASPSKGSE